MQRFKPCKWLHHTSAQRKLQPTPMCMIQVHWAGCKTWNTRGQFRMITHILHSYGELCRGECSKNPSVTTGFGQSTCGWIGMHHSSSPDTTGMEHSGSLRHPSFGQKCRISSPFCKSSLLLWGGDDGCEMHAWSAPPARNEGPSACTHFALTSTAMRSWRDAISSSSFISWA